MSEKCKYCNYVSKCSQFCEYNSVICKLHRSFPKIVSQSYEELQQENQSLKKENKILRENTEHNDKVVDKVNWENMLLKKENEQLKDNWNKLREWIVYNKHNENTEQHYLVVDYGTLLGKMIKLEQGSDSNG